MQGLLGKHRMMLREMNIFRTPLPPPLYHSFLDPYLLVGRCARVVQALCSDQVARALGLLLQQPLPHHTKRALAELPKQRQVAPGYVTRNGRASIAILGVAKLLHRRENFTPVLGALAL